MNHHSLCRHRNNINEIGFGMSCSQTKVSYSPKKKKKKKPTSADYYRWMLIWQDTFLSLTYDRPPSAITGIFPIPLTPYTEGLTFQESVFTICKIILNRTQLENSGDSHPPMENALDSRRELEAIWPTVAPFLRDKSRCTTLQQHLERLALGIHLGYAICRFTWMYMDSVRQQLTVLPDTIEDAVQQAIRPIEGFLDLHRFSSTVCRSWAFVHNAVSCAITLKSAEQMLPEETNRSEIIIQRLIVVLEKEERESEWVDTDTNVRHFGPYSRALKALREIYHDTET